MFKLITHYNNKPVSIQTSPERDTIAELMKVKSRDIDAIAYFAYDSDKLYMHVFLTA